MKIVVLDGHTANPGDLNWDEFKNLGDLEVFPRTGEDQIVSRLQGAAIAMTNKVAINRKTISALPDLRYIGVVATGYNIVDVEAARERGIIVTNVPEYSTQDVAQAVFALLLELTNHVGHHATTVRDGKWSKSKDFAYWDFPLIGLAGLSLGIIGYGRIGRVVGRIGLAFGMKILAPRRSTSPTNENDSVQYVELDTLLRESDVVSLHCPLTPASRGMVNSEFLAKMKPTAFLINTSRVASWMNRPWQMRSIKTGSPEPGWTSFPSNHRLPTIRSSTRRTVSSPHMLPGPPKRPVLVSCKSPPQTFARG